MPAGHLADWPELEAAEPGTGRAFDRFAHDRVGAFERARLDRTRIDRARFGEPRIFLRLPGRQRFQRVVGQLIVTAARHAVIRPLVWIAREPTLEVRVSQRLDAVVGRRSRLRVVALRAAADDRKHCCDEQKATDRGHETNRIPEKRVFGWPLTMTRRQRGWCQARVLVHARQRVAEGGTVSPQNGHVLVGAAGSGLTAILRIMKTTKATMAKSITAPRNAP